MEAKPLECQGDGQKGLIFRKTKLHGATFSFSLEIMTLVT